MYTRRSFLKKLLKCAVTGGFLSGWAYAKKKKTKPANIVLIVADDLGYECVGANGGTSYQTPVLDKLAASGVRFDYCYSQPICTPSRVKIMTGMYNFRNYERFGYLNWEQTTFANILKNAGFTTCIAGKWQLGGGYDAPGHFGFDEYCLWLLNRRTSRYLNPGLEINGRPVDYSNGEYGPDVVSDYICDFMERKKNQRFFVYYPMILPHPPFLPTPDSPEWNAVKAGSKIPEDRKYFTPMVAYMDKIVGKIVMKLEQLGLRQRTLVLFTSDNGTGTGIVSELQGHPVRGGKGKTTDSGTHVPLIANWPGVVPAGVVSPDLVDFSDFLPTICECARIQVPNNLVIDGQSFMPQLLGKKGKPRQWTYCWYQKSIFARSHQFKLYQTGKFYNLINDPEETAPLDVDKLDTSAAEVYRMLTGVLEKYKNLYPQEVK
jgi:arylsulfatase A